MNHETEVLIVGAGPVGLSGALALGRAGIKCLVLERRAEFSRYPKANGVHARTMELFREWGVAEPVSQSIDRWHAGGSHHCLADTVERYRVRVDLH